MLLYRVPFWPEDGLTHPPKEGCGGDGREQRLPQTIMRNMKSLAPLKIVATFAAALISAQTTRAAATTWNNAAGGNWSVPGNWSPSGVPGTSSDVIFGNTGAGAPNTNDVSSV